VRLARQLLEALLLGASTFAGVRLAQELQDPFSDLRLRGSTVVDRLREVTSK
jgi:hypothetical protein